MRALRAPRFYPAQDAVTAQDDFGLLVFGQWPDGLSLIGLVIIMVAGVSSVWFAGRGR